MGEFKKRWFQIVWACLLFASVVINYIQRWSDAKWAHGAGVEMLETILTWITVPLTVILFVWMCVGYWRESKRLFWRKWRRWGGALVLGVALAVGLVLMVRIVKGDSVDMDEQSRMLFIGIFAAGGLIYGLARYKFNHWRKDDNN